MNLKQGNLKIFFGYAAGVGKTYAMLEAAHEAASSGIDVVAGYVEPHQRPATSELIQGLECISPLDIVHRGIKLKEFNLDAALARKPELILVDELAHTNAPGSRHFKRYQDIEELLKAGIDVYTTINVQHIESLNDIVGSITGITVNERIPDKVFDEAHQVELIDIEPEELINRLMAGKIYRTAQANRALENFFKLENLVALREIALRRTADQVNYTTKKKATLTNGDYYTGEHILICLSGAPSNAKVIRTAARMASAFHGTFTALFVETPESKEISEEAALKLQANFKLAEQLGAKIVTVYGEDIPAQIAEYAKASGVSKVILGRSINKKGLIPKPTFVERLTAHAPQLDLYIIPDTQATVPPPKSSKFSASNTHALTNFTLKDTCKMLGLLIIATSIGYWFKSLGFSEANIITVYILNVLFTAIYTEGKLYSTLSSIISVLIFNFLFTEPNFSFSAYDAGYPITFLTMFISALITSTLTKRIKEQGKESALKARSTEVLLETSQKFQSAESFKELYDFAAMQFMKLLNRSIIIYPADETKGLYDPITFSPYSSVAFMHGYTTAEERGVAEWVYKNNKNAGATTHTLPHAKCLYFAVRSKDTVFAVVGIVMHEQPPLTPFERNLFMAMLSEMGLALEKAHIMRSKNIMATKAQQEQLRSNLLRAISHDLRSPLTSISGNANLLMNNLDSLDNAKIHELHTDIYDDAIWLINLVENLLSVTRLDNGNVALNEQPELLEEVISEALRHVNRKSTEHTLNVHLEDDFLMARMDSRLIIQVLINIIDNAIKYTPVGSHIDISAKKDKAYVVIEISDDGPGIPDEAKERIFDMFFTADQNKGDSRRGLGLGLSLCESIISAHGGTISVSDHLPHGTTFSFTLKREEL